MSRTLSTWTIYENPRDYPGQLVARRFECRVDLPEPVATDDVIVSHDLDSLRDELIVRGCVADFPRASSDEPQIVETWI